MGFLGSSSTVKKRELGSGLAEPIVGRRKPDLPVHTNLMKMVNIAVCGAKRVGKSSLIDAFCQKHITSCGTTSFSTSAPRPGERRYAHPDDSSILFHEINIADAAVRDFMGFAFVFVLFEHFADKQECETARRAHERDIPVAFIGTKADLQSRRLAKLSAVESSEIPTKVRQLINSKCSKEFYTLPEIQRTLYIVAIPAMWETATSSKRSIPSLFDETALIKRYVLMDVNTGKMLMSTTVNAVSCESAYLPKSARLRGSALPETYVPRSGRMLAGSTSFAPGRPRTNSEYSVEFPSTAAPQRSSFPWSANYSESGNSTARSNEYATSRNSKAIASSHMPALAEYKVCFIEPLEYQPTLMESVLGYKPGANQSLIPQTAYRHPEYQNAIFFLVPLANYKDVVLFFQNNGLGLMRLLIVCYVDIFKDAYLNIVKEARRIGVDVIVAQRVIDGGENKISPRRAFNKLRKLGGGGNASAKLHKAGLASVCSFEVNPRLLRIPHSYPQTEEEDFKNHISLVCKGKTPMIASSVANAGIADSRCIRPPKKRTGAYQGDMIFPASEFASVSSSSCYANDDQTGVIPYHAAPPKSSIKPDIGNSANAVKSVVFDCRKHTLVAVIGSAKTGKTTLVKHTMGTRPNPPVNNVDEGETWIVRHPDFYDVIIHDYPGYDRNDQQVGTMNWMHKHKLHTMDWIILVFNEYLEECDLQIIQFSVNSQIPIVCVASKADELVDKFIYEKHLTEASSIDKTRSTIFQQYWLQMDEIGIDSPPLFILSGRALETKTRTLFDEEQYLQMSK